MMPAPARKTANNTTTAGSSSSAHPTHSSSGTTPSSASAVTSTTTAAAAAAAAEQQHQPPDANAAASTSDPIPLSGPSGTHHHLRGPSSVHDTTLVTGALADSPADSHASPDDGGSGTAPEDQRSKKRKGGPGSRGVANLTPEQLAKKRANDREAQRAIRERTKHTIENLENKIKELTSQQPYQELQAVLREKEAVEQELVDVKNRMASIMSLIQPVLGSQQGVYASPGPSFMPNQAAPAAAAGLDAGAASSTPASTASPHSAPSWQQPGLQSAGSSTQTSPQFDTARIISQQRHNSLHALDLGPGGEQLKLNFLLDGTPLPVNRMPSGDGGAQDTANYQHTPMKHDWTGFMPAGPPGSTFAAGASPMAHNMQPHANFASGQGGPPQPHGSSTWPGPQVLIANCAPTCPLDSLLLDFLNERRQRAAEGMSAQEVVGPRYPSVRSLLNPQQSQHSHPVSKVFTDILRAFPGISHLPEKVAVLYLMFLTMRWQIDPIKENYDRLPSALVPLPSQSQIQHPAWVDHIPFPDMRDKIVKAYRHHANAQADFPFSEFFVPFTDTLSVNWPYGETDVLIETPDGELLINPVFETHMKRLGNWTLGEAFDRTFPQLRGTYKLKKGSAAS